MKKIGQGWQSTVYDLGNGRVLKKVNNRWQTFWLIFWYRFPRNIKRAYLGYGGIMRLARNSLDFLKPHLADLKNVLANPTINSDYSYEQDWVTPVIVYFKNHTYEENIKIIDQYVNLIFLFWSYGFGEQPFKLLLNYGVTSTGELVFFDLGELYFTKEKATERIQSRHWYKTYFPSGVELKAYYFKKMDEVMNIENLERYWQQVLLIRK